MAGSLSRSEAAVEEGVFGTKSGTGEEDPLPLELVSTSGGGGVESRLPIWTRKRAVLATEA